MAQSISASVGAGGVNRSDDTHTVQQLLNNVPVPRGGPSPKLDTDGKCGPITIGAIRRFQQLNTGFVDGRVDPGGQTIAKLNTYGWTGGGGSPGGGASTNPGTSNHGNTNPGNMPPLPPLGQVSGVRKQIIDLAQQWATPHPGKVSDLRTIPEPGSGRQIREGWQSLKDFFDVAVAGWQPTYWNNKAYIDGVKVPGKRIPQPGRDGVSWCGIFATYVLIQAGLPVKWVLGKGIAPLPLLADQNFQPGDVLVMKGGTVNHCIAIADDGSSMSTVNGNSDNQSILIKPQTKSQVAYYYKVTP